MKRSGNTEIVRLLRTEKAVFLYNRKLRSLLYKNVPWDAYSCEAEI